MNYVGSKVCQTVVLYRLLSLALTDFLIQWCDVWSVTKTYLELQLDIVQYHFPYYVKLVPWNMSFIKTGCRSVFSKVLNSGSTLLLPHFLLPVFLVLFILFSMMVFPLMCIILAVLFIYLFVMRFTGCLIFLKFGINTMELLHKNNHHRSYRGLLISHFELLYNFYQQQ